MQTSQSVQSPCDNVPKKSGGLTAVELSWLRVAVNVVFFAVVLIWLLVWAIEKGKCMTKLMKVTVLETINDS